MRSWSMTSSPASTEAGCRRAFPRSPMAICTLAMPRAICLNYGLAEQYGGKSAICGSTTPTPREEQEYVDSIRTTYDGWASTWEDRLFFASDYFEQLHDWAVKLIKTGKAFVCDLSQPTRSANTGVLSTEPGKNSPYRESSGR